MNRLRQEMQLIPRTAWMIADCVWLGFFLLMMLVPFRLDPEARYWPLAGKLALAVLPGLPLLILVLLIGYVYADARRGHALYHVDAAGNLHPQCHRDHFVLHPAGAAVGAVPAVHFAGAARPCLLSELRRGPGARLPAMPARRGAGLVALRKLRRRAQSGLGYATRMPWRSDSFRNWESAVRSVASSRRARAR